LTRANIIFTPHLLPIRAESSPPFICISGEPQTKAGIAQVYEKFFTGSPMVRLYDKALPQIQLLRSHCYADIGSNSPPTAVARSSQLPGLTC